ncbi:MAG: hypothetical protein KIT83_02860 [Bryobacterales bacterium]|nr:hypothetical protein [Bryobacterales bacterium]
MACPTFPAPRTNFWLASLALVILAALTPSLPAQQKQISGIYPHLALFNEGSECGTGGVVPWADRLWVITYSPHQPFGGSDKLYEIDDALTPKIRPESIGGTPANRMIHRESQQLFIGPYVIDAKGKVRVIPFEQMPGRPTGNARHLTDPAKRIYVASMEEGFYDVDVNSLEVTQLYEDANVAVRDKRAKDVAGPLLPGYHGKGFYSGQGRVVYANNGEVGGGLLPPDIPSGCLAEWNGKDWRVVRRNQFTEVSGPGGIFGNNDPERDPIWSTGWDHRSVILMLLDKGRWHAYRLPKAAHTYDGAHGWNTEWPRIREIGEKDLLMTMHGTFWRFPSSFTAANSAGIAPRSTYLKVIGDFTRWKDRIVFGADDSAKSEFLNTRAAKGKIAGPGQSQSNLWFVEPAQLDRFGPVIGRGGVWLRDDLKAGEASEPYLFAGYERRLLHLAHASDQAITFTLEVDQRGNGQWRKLREITVPAVGYNYTAFSPTDRGVWLRLKPNRAVRSATAYFHYSNADTRSAQASAIFAGLAKPGANDASRGWLWARGENRGTLLFAQEDGLYEMGPDLALHRLSDTSLHTWVRENLAPPRGALGTDAASVIYIDDKGNRWRLPKGDAAFDNPGVTEGVRIAREIVTERDLFNAHGTLYELPAINAGGVAVVRPVATHNMAIHDFASWRGLLVLSGVATEAPSNPHIVRSADGKAALWLGVADDLWQLGKPRGEGGPWHGTAVTAGTPSDPYLMTGYDRKHLTLSHDRPGEIPIRVEVDITGTGHWQPYATFAVPAGRPFEHQFPAGFDAYWVRATALADATATAQFRYE